MEGRRIRLKIISILLSMSILLQVFMPITSLAANDIRIEMSSEATELKQGEVIYIDLHIGGDEIASISGYLHYDTTIFGEVRKKNWIIPEQLKDEGHGDWTANYNIDNKKVVIEETNGDKFEIPDDGLIVQLKLEVLRDVDTATIDLKTIEVDGSRKKLLLYR